MRVIGCLAGPALAFIMLAGEGRGQVVLDSGRHDYGEPGQPEWEEFVGKVPDGRRMEVNFLAQKNAGEATLLIRQRDVKYPWSVLLNGKPLGTLMPMEAALVLAVPVPPGALQDGSNALTIEPPRERDDVVLGEVVLDPRPRPQALSRAHLTVRVTDSQTRQPLPCRITVADSHGALAALWVEPAAGLAIRPGVVYTKKGAAEIGLRPGEYVVYASRGPEYSLAQQRVTLKEGSSASATLSITREVPTPGLVACDTHIHTLQISGHGDASLAERLVTLAGEGVELPIATEHNTLADYGPEAERLGLRGELTPVIGDEVTTSIGHFNAFAFAAGERAPDASLGDWPALLRAIRAGRADRVVILNHPCDVHSGFRPFDPANFDAAAGAFVRWPEPKLDALEVVNSGALRSDLMEPVRGWFALWNHGTRVAAVGASDSHDVSRFIVGQGRTYIVARDDDPGHLDVQQACRSLRSLHAVVSLGLIARITVDNRFHEGDVASGIGESLTVAVDVLGPSWIDADRVVLYANGQEVGVRAIEAPGAAGLKARTTWTLPRLKHDVCLVAIASGPGVSTPAWALPRPYQATSLAWRPRVLSITNPVLVDADGDGACSSPRALAESLWKSAARDVDRLIAALAGHDEAVATQAAELCRSAGVDLRAPSFRHRLESAPDAVRRGFAAVSARP